MIINTAGQTDIVQYYAKWLIKRFSGYVDRCIFSFVEMYKRLAQNMPELIWGGFYTPSVVFSRALL